MNNLTVLIPTSPIPSHPSTAILDETIANIRKYTDAEIIIMCDGVHSSLEHRRGDYKRYIDAIQSKKVNGDYGNCHIPVFENHEHQARMTRFVLQNMVKTPLIMFCEHDCSPIGDIPFEKICEYVATEDSSYINCIRFNIFDKTPAEHQYLMLSEEPETIHEWVVGGEVVKTIKATRTIQWSQRPHIAKAQWYRNILKTFFPPNDKTMIEDVMHSVVQTQYDLNKRDDFGLAIYAPDEGTQLRSYHSDARGSDEKIITG